MNLTGSRIRERRKELNLTQLQIKQKVGISSGNMSDIENGNIMPSAATLVLLSEALNCSIDWMLTGNSFKSENPLFSDSRDSEVFNMYSKLNLSDKTQIKDLIEFKLFKYNELKKGNLSASGNGDITSGIA